MKGKWENLVFKKKKFNKKSIKEWSIIKKILSIKNKYEPKIKWPVPFSIYLMWTISWNCFSKCRTKIILFCKASDIILVTHSLPIQIMIPAVDDTFYVNNINMKIEQTSYNSVMLLLNLRVFISDHCPCPAYQICKHTVHYSESSFFSSGKLFFFFNQ